MAKFVMECPNCGKYAEASEGFFARKIIDCSCGNAINVCTDKLSCRECPKCGNNVVFDQSKGEKAKCPVCHEPINTMAEQDETVEFACAQCGINLRTSKAAATYTCPVCDFVNDVQERAAMKKIKHADLAQQCDENAEISDMDMETKYNDAVKIMDEAKSKFAFNMAAEYFKSISGWKDADKLYEKCQQKIKEFESQDEVERLDRERETEEKLKSEEKRKKTKKLIAAVGIPTVCFIILFIFLSYTVIIPNVKLSKAKEYASQNYFFQAIDELEGLDNNEQVRKLRHEIAISGAEYFASQNDFYTAIDFLERTHSSGELREEIAISGAKYYASKNDYSSAIFVLRGAESAEARSLKEEYERKYYRLELYQPDISYPDTSKLINDWHGITEPSDSPGITKPTEDR